MINGSPTTHPQTAAMIAERIHHFLRRRVADPERPGVGDDVAFENARPEASAINSARFAPDEKGASASATSAGVLNRSAGFFANMRSTMVSSSDDTSGFASDISGAGCSA